MRPSRTIEKWHVELSVRSEHVANRSRKSGMSRISEIWPVSYYSRGILACVHGGGGGIATYTKDELNGAGDAIRARHWVRGLNARTPPMDANSASMMAV